MPRKESIVNASTAQAQQDSASMGIDAYELPKSVVTKLARSALPENAKMQKEMLLAVLKGSTVFVNYLATNAHEVASSRQHKSVSASDVLRALEQMDMGDIVPKLQAELEVYRNNQKGDKGKKAVARGKANADSISAGTGSAKSKGKEKATLITIPASGSASLSSDNATRREPDEDAEMETQPSHRHGDDEDEEMQDPDLDEDEGDVDEDEPEDEGDEGEGEDIVDDVELEKEELRRDARGVEERDYDE